MIRSRWFPHVLLLAGLAILIPVILWSRPSTRPCPPDAATLQALREPPSSAPAFVEVSTFFGPRDISSTWGVSWGDVDLDGDPDLFASVHMHYASALWINDEGRGFSRSTAFSGSESGLDDHMGLWFDFDGDGDFDLYTANGYHRPDRLLRNDGDQEFVDVTEEAGTTCGDRGRGRSAIGADLTGNGFDDLFVLNCETPNFLYRNLGNGQFLECAEKCGVGDAYGKVGAAIGDLDGDGDLDIYIPVCAFNVCNRLLLNRGDGTFVDRSTGSGADVAGKCQGSSLGDADGDGDLDIFVARADGHVLLRNDGNARFTNVSREAGVSFGGQGEFNAGFADLDNDGDLDLFITSGGHAEGLNGDDVLLRNRGDGTFENVSVPAGIQRAVRGNAAAVAFADYNFDGFLDFVVSNGNGHREISGPLQLYRNRGLPSGQQAAGHWLDLRTERDHGSREGNGARIRVCLSDGRTVLREAGSMRAMAQDQAGVHVGLGPAEYVRDVSVDWPDGSHAQMQGIPADRVVIIAARQEPRYVGSHPEALLGRIPTFDIEKAEQELRRHLADDQCPEPSLEDVTDRTQELLAYVIADDLFRRLEISDAEIQSVYESRLPAYEIPKRYFIEQIALGKFTTSWQQQPLPWQLANRIKDQLKKGDDAFEVVTDANIRAHGDGKRGYLETGWFTESMLQERYGDFTSQLIQSREGQIRGPVKIKEGHDIQDEDLVWPVLRLFRVGPSVDGVVLERELVEQDLVSGIRRDKLRSVFKEFGAQVGSSSLPSRQGVMSGIRYDIPKLAARARDEGLPEREEVQRGLLRIQHEARLNAAIRHLIAQQEPTAAGIEARIQQKRDEWTAPAQVEGTLLSFASRSLAESAKRQLDAGEPLQAVIQNLKIPPRQSLDARRENTYFLSVRLDAENSRQILGEGAFDRLLPLQPGRCSDVFPGPHEFHAIVVDAQHPPEPLADSRAQSLAWSELRRAFAAELVRCVLGIQ